MSELRIYECPQCGEAFDPNDDRWRITRPPPVLVEHAHDGILVTARLPRVFRGEDVRPLWEATRRIARADTWADARDGLSQLGRAFDDFPAPDDWKQP